MTLIVSLLRRGWGLPGAICRFICLRLPYFRFVRDTRDAQNPNTLGDWYRQEIKGVNRGPYWPVHPASMVTGWKNILIGVDTSPGLMPGCYIQGIGKIRIGDYTQIGPNASIISANHDPENLRNHICKEVDIGRHCWLGAGSVVLPGVTLGHFTMVGAGSIVTKSFPKGYQVLAGNPARIIADLDPENCAEIRNTHEYHGYIPASEFERFRNEVLKV
ncbi:MAG: acyltransferase [Pseudomonadota bacterium]